MEQIGLLLIFGAALGIGFGLQALIRVNPLLIILFSLVLVLVLAPVWSLGLMGGAFICCAFVTHQAAEHDPRSQVKVITWKKVMFFAVLTFSGFLLTLILLLKVKLSTSLPVHQREVLAWLFLVMVETCFFRIVARLCPNWYRIRVGYAMGILNFLMLLYWVLPLGYAVTGLTFISLLIINPLLLVWVDLPISRIDGVLLGGRR